MIGTPAHSRTRRMTSSPSMSGSPRSTMTMSGWREATSTRPSAPVVASKRRYPWVVSVARRKRRICGSSSIRTTAGSGIAGRRVRGLAGQRQREEKRNASARKVLGPDVAAVRLDNAPTDGQAEPGAPPGHGITPDELLEHVILLARRQSWPLVGDLHGDRLVGGRGEDRDGRCGRRVLQRV